jgi:hypothetical protein
MELDVKAGVVSVPVAVGVWGGCAPASVVVSPLAPEQAVAPTTTSAATIRNAPTFFRCRFVSISVAS